MVDGVLQTGNESVFLFDNFLDLVLEFGDLLGGHVALSYHLAQLGVLENYK